MLATREDWAETPDFHVWVDLAADPPYVGVSGEIDLLTCAPFRDALSEAAEQGAQVIAVDLRHVTFMGSTGIRELVRALRTVERIELRSPTPIVRRALVAAALGPQVAVVTK